MKTIMSTGLSWLWLGLVIFALDISSKQWIRTNLVLGESVSVIQFVNFTYIHNSGAAFSILADKGELQRWAFAVIAVIIMAALLIIMYRSDQHARLSNSAYAMIIGGALGNLFDRITYGVVIDFLDLYVGDWHWPTFNVADASICIGAVLIVLEELSVQKNMLDRSR